ncbi:beta family protein [Peribacillus frigoritolerans]|uniref:beta family protein n=1 Tax=Peribacillus castrilensis TaxID=2897690 RepID=UPI00296ECDAC|nr:beta family protein [Peribacillus castrilensis]
MLFKQNQYIPIIRWKRGEQTALKELDPKIKNSITPVIEIPPIDWDFENEMPKKTIDKHLLKVAEQLSVCWNNPNPLFIDASQVCIEDDEVMVTGEHPLEYIFSLLTAANISAVPVASFANGNNYHKATKAVLTKYQTGFGIRLKEQDFDDIDHTLEWFTKNYNINSNDIDLIVDYDYIDPKSAVRTANLILGSLLSIPDINSWRTFSLVTAAMPDNLSKIPTGTDGAFPRSEWTIFKKIYKSTLTRYPAFGDYIISNPEYKQIDPRFIKMAAGIRYTTPEEYLIFRGYSVTSPKHGKWKQTQGLCQRIVSHPLYYGRNYSYGDQYIDYCVSGSVSTGRAETWRTVGTNHHLTLVVKELSNFHASSIVGSP